MKTFQLLRRTIRSRRTPVNKPAQAEANHTLLQEALGYPVQTKLKVGSPNDAHEREADAVADRVMAMPEATVQRAPAESEQEDEQKKKAAEQPAPDEQEEEDIQRKAIGGEATVTAAGAAAIGARQGGGQALPASERAFFEPRMGVDFGRVRLHTDAEAAQLSAGLSARAFTVGSDVFFGQGEYQPSTSSGRRLLAHELTHVLQQAGPGRAGRSENGPGHAGPEKGMVRRQADIPSVSTVAPMIMRSVIFSSTIDIRLRVLESRKFSISKSGIRVTADAGYPNPASCNTAGYDMELREVNRAWFDSSHGSRHFPHGVSHTASWSGLTAGETYYLVISPTRPPMMPRLCALQGNITVEE